MGSPQLVMPPSGPHWPTPRLDVNMLSLASPQPPPTQHKYCADQPYRGPCCHGANPVRSGRLVAMWPDLKPTMWPPPLQAITNHGLGTCLFQNSLGWPDLASPWLRQRQNLTQSKPIHYNPTKVGPKSPQTCPKVGPKSAQTCPKVGPKSAQSCPKVGPKSAQSCPKVGPKSAQSCPKVGPKSAQTCLKVGPKSTQSCPKVGPKSVQSCPKVGPCKLVSALDMRQVAYMRKILLTTVIRKIRSRIFSRIPYWRWRCLICNPNGCNAWQRAIVAMSHHMALLQSTRNLSLGLPGSLTRKDLSSSLHII